MKDRVLMMASSLLSPSPFPTHRIAMLDFLTVSLIFFFLFVFLFLCVCVCVFFLFGLYMSHEMIKMAV